MKFGGTSVGSSDRFRQVLDIVKEQWQLSGKPPVVVLSAMSGITNALIECSKKANEQNLSGALAQFNAVKNKHLSLLNELFKNNSDCTDLIAELEPIFTQLEVLLKGVAYLGELSKRSLDAISGSGELLSTKIFAAYAKSQNIAVRWADAREFIVTDDTFGQANPTWEKLTPKTKDLLTSALTAGQCVVTQGFIGATVHGITTTLGRGGSDYSASIIGAALDAGEIQIWTDVDGMMTADPRIVPNASLLPEVSFQEASELAYFGAKVLHPLTIKPAIEKKIPVRILNTMNPGQKGTLITASPTRTPSNPTSSIASKKGLTAVFIHSLRMLMAHGFLAKVFEIFARYETPIDLIATSEVSVSLTIDRTDQLAAIVEALSDLGDVHILPNVAIVTVVGRQFRHQSGVAGQVFNALKDINIIMISGGASDINLSCVIGEQDADKAVKQLHEELFKK